MTAPNLPNEHYSFRHWGWKGITLPHSPQLALSLDVIICIEIESNFKIERIVSIYSYKLHVEFIMYKLETFETLVKK